ncbi:MAG TPA: DUF1385 domain-containing protein [Dehalococcoidia bacterium]|nr:DUF1385 domain-containing protein [Dehalococcoidia bacterium]|tara:strand:- start:1683 stop:2579 length:897 start_codon:yes stop_codon:yes gene_type:complete
MADNSKHTYGGQAVIEGVMIRGKSHYSLAVRRPDGTITTIIEPLNHVFTSKFRNVPLLRGILVLAETLSMGIKSLHKSSVLSTENSDDIDEKPISNLSLILTIIFSVGIAIIIFFITPVVLLEIIDKFLPSPLISNILEGILRLVILVAYVAVIGFFPDIKRVYQYHGAEHMSIHALEASEQLTVSAVKKYPTPHPRCGTAFLLTVMVVSIFIFSLLGETTFLGRIISRIILIPVIASISYEIIRYAGTHKHSLVSTIVSQPGLLLQRITTQTPDDSQIEVAISAVTAVIEADNNELA